MIWPSATPPYTTNPLAGHFHPDGDQIQPSANPRTIQRITENPHANTVQKTASISGEAMTAGRNKKSRLNVTTGHSVVETNGRSIHQAATHSHLLRTTVPGQPGNHATIQVRRPTPGRRQKHETDEA